MENKARILFRADGNKDIGLGHIYRCIAIAERLKNEFSCFFAATTPSSSLNQIISASTPLIELKEYKDRLSEAQFVAELIHQYKIDIVTLDGYHFDTAYQNVLKKDPKLVVVSIDDDQPFHYTADVVINHSKLKDNSIISKETYTKLFTGYDYLMLRKEFLQNKNIPKEIKDVKKILICFGGSDPNNHTKKIVDCFIQHHTPYELNIVIGSHYHEKQALKQSIKGMEHIHLFCDLDATALSDLMHVSHLAIVPSSTMGLEAFASKLILITGLTAQNQKNIYNGLITEETVLGVGDFDDLVCDDLLKHIDTLSEKFRNYSFRSAISTTDQLVNLYKSLC